MPLPSPDLTAISVGDMDGTGGGGSEPRPLPPTTCGGLPPIAAPNALPTEAFTFVDGLAAREVVALVDDDFIRETKEERLPLAAFPC